MDNNKREWVAHFLFPIDNIGRGGGHMPVTRDDLGGLQGQLLSVKSSDAALVRQEVTDALESFSERGQESLLNLVGRATAVINQARQSEKAAEVLLAINPT